MKLYSTSKCKFVPDSSRESGLAAQAEKLPHDQGFGSRAMVRCRAIGLSAAPELLLLLVVQQNSQRLKVSQSLNACIGKVTTVAVIDQAFVKKTLAGRDNFLARIGMYFDTGVRRGDVKLHQKVHFFGSVTG